MQTPYRTAGMIEHGDEMNQPNHNGAIDSHFRVLARKPSLTANPMRGMKIELRSLEKT